MMTNTTEFPGKRPLCLLLVLLPLLLQSIDGVAGVSFTWGHVNKYASTLYTENIYLSHNMPSKNVVYGSENADGYTITALHVEDLTAVNGNDSEPILVQGGIGQSFAVVRFQRHQNLSVSQDAHFMLTIYGLDL
ncbi:uncharacterized protein Dwil_GK23181 [Drosophila willistoni]|uniref:Dirigent protein n=1 Tax=Drosophila willistoni TaxID=7260 RepID=B4NMN6_DROWI|nr:uncharacterized protein LOC6652541 [Drosophila willistoni]EDW85625.2 uncharacterized protein Dwil_GK23181 [Drosophila willistoni]